MYDVLIVGGGITGTLLARELSRYQLKIALVEKENDIACGTTMANSAIVHTGYDPEDDTLKALLNVRGAKMYEALCKELGCHYKQVGAFVAACGKEEEEKLVVLKDRAIRRKIEVEEVSGDKARDMEPALNENITKALYFPTTAVIYPWEVALAACEVAVKNGMDLYLNQEVKGIIKNDNFYTVSTDKQTFEAKLVVNAAGVYAEAIYRMVSDTPNFTITPKKGEYYVLDNGQPFVKHICFPVPGPKGKGILGLPTLHENTLFGPNNITVQDAGDVSTDSVGLAEVKAGVNKLFHNPPFNQSIRTFAGLRPSSDRGDFIIEEAPDVEGFINVAGIESPGLASAPAIAQYTVETILSKKLECKENPKAVMGQPSYPVLRELSREERNALIQKNPLYGRVICRCVEVSEGEMLDAIHRTIGAKDIKGMKKRVSSGFGRCQGGFCEPRVMGILSRELGIPFEEVTYDGEGSRILLKENR